jgi:cob(I)alamin adenosyltransferase
MSKISKIYKKSKYKKRKQNINEIYWGKPVPGFGNLNSKLAIIGLLLLLMVEQELEELLLEINQEIFYLNVYMKLEFQILHFQKI